MSVLLRDAGENPGRDAIKANQIAVLRDTQGRLVCTVANIPFQDDVFRFHDSI
jgi:hypothetical protein